MASLRNRVYIIYSHELDKPSQGLRMDIVHGAFEYLRYDFPPELKNGYEADDQFHYSAFNLDPSARESLRLYQDLATNKYLTDDRQALKDLIEYDASYIRPLLVIRDSQDQPIYVPVNYPQRVVIAESIRTLVNQWLRAQTAAHRRH